MRLENRVAVVAGATGALGKVAAREFAKEGAHLVLLGRSLESLETVAREAGLSEDRYLPITADVTDGKATRSAADKTMARFGRVEHCPGEPYRRGPRKIRQALVQKRLVVDAGGDRVNHIGPLLRRVE